MFFAAYPPPPPPQLVAARATPTAETVARRDPQRGSQPDFSDMELSFVRTTADGPSDVPEVGRPPRTSSPPLVVRCGARPAKPRLRRSLRIVNPRVKGFDRDAMRARQNVTTRPGAQTAFHPHPGVLPT